jgi:periplasmic divalent cation tolerance protein
MCVVLTSEATAEQAETLARSLLERRLVVCASLLPVRSLYHWQGKLECGAEVKLLLKTTPAHLEALHHGLLELHSYQTPEWIVLSGSTRGGYGQWLEELLG